MNDLSLNTVNSLILQIQEPLSVMKLINYLSKLIKYLYRELLLQNFII